jgi:16S rRNA (guanine527-N7)-methyltransferase
VNKAVDVTTVKRLAERHELGAPAVEQLRMLAELLSSDSRAPTSVRDPVRVIDDHLADSLVALDTVRLADAVADIGSGAGLPGLPLAIAVPRVSFAVVESARRKCEFIERAVAACRIANARVVNARVEAWPEGIGSFDVVTARAVAPLAVVAEYAAPLLRIGGVAVVWRGRRDRVDEDAAAAACAELGLEVSEIRRVQPYRGAEHRHLHLMSKVMDTPDGFPRRPGMAAKRPLGTQR